MRNTIWNKLIKTILDDVGNLAEKSLGIGGLVSDAFEGSCSDACMEGFCEKCRFGRALKEKYNVLEGGRWIYILEDIIRNRLVENMVANNTDEKLVSLAKGCKLEMAFDKNDGKDNYFVYASPIWCPADERITILFKGGQTLEKGFEILWIRNGTVKEFMDEITKISTSN